ncbi:MAG: hypothetical protein HYX66_04075 [Ignavibacteria bacterium]|nr:hypothetical protein [Ignavibacteria bacterium]
MIWTLIRMSVLLFGILLPAQLCASDNPFHVRDSLLHVTGARGWLPCTDGSLIGAYINCGNLTPGRGIYECSQPVVSRSWDGGVTWAIENVDAPDFSYSKMVRLRGGNLLSPHNRWFGGFITSTDAGRSWTPTFDSTIFNSAYDVGGETFQLFRDYRGILFWLGGGILYYSLDNGASRAAIMGAFTRENYYVLPPNGLMVTTMIEAGTDPSEIQMSLNHGKTWFVARREYSNYDSSLDITGLAIVRDTVVAGQFLYKWRPGRARFYTEYWNSGELKWQKGLYRGECWTFDAMVDSADSWYGWEEDGFYRLKSGDSTCVRIVRASDSTRPLKPADSLLPLMKAMVEGMFYDLAGNVHPNGSDVVISTGDSRPISRIDRMYVCGGVEFVIGGRQLEAIWLEDATTSNAALTYTTTQNNMLATVEVNAVDSSLPMRFSFIVQDPILGQQRFVDSVIPISGTPDVRLWDDNDIPYKITCSYKDGPYMWYKDGIPWQLPGAYVGTVYGDSVIQMPKPGRYMVKGRNNNGCDVFSQVVSVGITDVFSDGVADGDAFQVITKGNEIRIRGNRESEAVSILAYDLLGNAVSLKMSRMGFENVISTVELSGIIALVLTDSSGNQERRIVLVQ